MNILQYKEHRMAKFSQKLQSKEEQSQATTNHSTRENLISDADKECLMLGKKPKSEGLKY